MADAHTTDESGIKVINTVEVSTVSGMQHSRYLIMFTLSLLISLSGADKLQAVGQLPNVEIKSFPRTQPHLFIYCLRILFPTKGSQNYLLFGPF